MRLFALLLALLLPPGAALAQRQTPPLTKTWVRSVSPETVTRRLFGDLAGMMLPLPDRGEAGVRPTRPLRALSFYSIPRAGLHYGICETDGVRIHFVPAGPDRGADTEMRPRSIASTRFYFIQDRPAFRREMPHDEAADARQERSCAAADPRRLRLISGDADYRIAAAMRLVLNLADAVRTGPVPFVLDCSSLAPRESPMSEAQCLAAFARIDPDRVDTVQACRTTPTPDTCFRVSTDGWEVIIMADGRNRSVLRATIEELVSFADRLID